MPKLQRKERLKRGEPMRLISHRLSIDVFGEDPGKPLCESIRENGLLEPITVAADELTVVSGWRRRCAAVTEGVKRVDIRVRDDLIDPLDIDEAVLEYNVRAPQTREMTARALAARQRIAMERAALAGKKVTATEATKIAAAESGESLATTRRAIDVVKKESELRESGKVKEADELIETLNDEGFAQAKEKADELIPPTPRSKPDTPKTDGKPDGKAKPDASPAKQVPSISAKLNASEKKRLTKAREHFNALIRSLPKPVFKEVETYIDLTRKVFDRYER